MAKITAIHDLAGRSAPGDKPAGLYWAMPLVVAAATCGGAAALVWGSSHAARAAGIAAWILTIAAAFWHVVRQRRWDREQHRRRLSALEAVIQLTAASGAADGSEDQIIGLLPGVIRAMVGPKSAIVGLLEDENQYLRIVAADGVDPSLIGERLTLASMPLARECLRTRRASTVLDLNHPARPIDSSLGRRLGLRTMMVAPLIYQDQAIGIMIVASPSARAMTELDLKRVSLWASLTAVMMANCRMYKRMNHSMREQQRLWEHRDALYAVNTAIQSPGTLEEKLQQIADLSPGPLEMDGTLIWMKSEDEADELVVAAVSHPLSAAVRGYRLKIAGSKTEAVMRRKKVVVVENGLADAELNPFLKSHLPHGSLIFEPLLTRTGEPLGLLVLMRKQAGRFGTDQIDMARMFSARAAATIEMTQLYQQTRRDADDKAILLRELNHRVKNNLASIVSLLSLNQPALDAQTRQWLDRAVERIGAMAQAHNLFSRGQEGAQRVTLAELVEQTVRSVSVAKAPGVIVKVELEGATSLRADRAVNLAMAMHEICYNGLVHSLGGGGTLTIRSRRDNGDLTVEVEDDAGAGRPAPEPLERAAHGRTGIGLSLVRGLVGRELRGRFTLSQAAGGARATVQFPLLPDEAAGAAA